MYTSFQLFSSKFLISRMDSSAFAVDGASKIFDIVSASPKCSAILYLKKYEENNIKNMETTNKSK